MLYLKTDTVSVILGALSMIKKGTDKNLAVPAEMKQKLHLA